MEVNNYRQTIAVYSKKVLSRALARQYRREATITRIVRFPIYKNINLIKGEGCHFLLEKQYKNRNRHLTFEVVLWGEQLKRKHKIMNILIIIPTIILTIKL